MISGGHASKAAKNLYRRQNASTEPVASQTGNASINRAQHAVGGTPFTRVSISLAEPGTGAADLTYRIWYPG